METATPNNLNDDRAGLRSPPWLVVALGGGGVAALAAGLGLALGREDGPTMFSASYLVSFCFFLSISLGALFFVALQHVVRAGWSVAVRRLAEILAANIALMAVLFLPILVPLVAGHTGMSKRIDLYEWSAPPIADSLIVDEDQRAEQELLRKKAPYLNVPFFAGRAIVYFAVWILAAAFFLSRSTQQDESADPELTRRMQRWSAPVLVLFGLTITFASFDWLMSLEPTWFSTIYGLYFFSGSVVAFFAALILLAAGIQRSGRLTESITTDHYHELGKLLLGFIIFWGYMAFSQYMLIWYANIPEETVWYLDRQTGPWACVSIALLFGHLLIPFFGLLSREVKRRKILLGAWAVWILVFHWIDLYWLVMPTFAPEHLPLGLTDLCCMVGIGSLFLAGVLRTAESRALVAVGDPRLCESAAFENF